MLTEIESIDRDGEETSEEYSAFHAGMAEFRSRPKCVDGRNGWDICRLWTSPAEDRQPMLRFMLLSIHPSDEKDSEVNCLRLHFPAPAKPNRKTSWFMRMDIIRHPIAFLKHHGFEVAGTSGVMVAPVTELPQAEIPHGYSVRRYPELGDPPNRRPGIESIVTRIWWDIIKTSPAQTATSNYYGSEGIHLLFDPDDKLIGICAGNPEGKTDEHGSVRPFGCSRSNQRNIATQGFQRFLTLTVMNWLREKGTRPITLEYWGDDEKPLAIYRTLGFELVNQQITYHKELE